MGVIDSILISVLVFCMVWAIRGIFQDRKAPVDSMVYVASPFSSNSKDVEEERYFAIVEICARLFEKGFNVVSPMVHCYPMFSHGNMPGDFGFWKRYDYALLSRCSGLWVVTLDGWRESVGVRGELEFATKRGIPVKYVDVDERGEIRFSERNGFE